MRAPAIFRHQSRPSGVMIMLLVLITAGSSFAVEAVPSLPSSAIAGDAAPAPPSVPSSELAYRWAGTLDRYLKSPTPELGPIIEIASQLRNLDLHDPAVLSALAPVTARAVPYFVSTTLKAEPEGATSQRRLAAEVEKLQVLDATFGFAFTAGERNVMRSRAAEEHELLENEQRDRLAERMNEMFQALGSLPVHPEPEPTTPTVAEQEARYGSVDLPAAWKLAKPTLGASQAQKNGPDLRLEFQQIALAARHYKGDNGEKYSQAYKELVLAKEPSEALHLALARSVGDM